MNKDQALATLSQLTPREAEVLRLMALDNPNKGIARALGISPRTVEVHRLRAIRKLGVRSVFGALQVMMLADSLPPEDTAGDDLNTLRMVATLVTASGNGDLGAAVKLRKVRTLLQHHNW